jgi:hypothetical protein
MVDPAVVALSIPIVALLCGTALRIARMFAPQGPPAGTGDLASKVDAMEQELATLRQELAETQERLDFTERLLARNNEPPQLGPNR